MSKKGIAGALAMASSTTAYGMIVLVSPPPNLTNVPGGANTSANWDVNGDGTIDFRFLDRYPNTAPGGYGVIWQMSMNPAAVGNGLISYSGMFVRYAYALGFGATIGPGDPRFSTQTQVVLGSKYSYGSGGVNYYGGFAANGPNESVPPGTFAFVGFRFLAADGMHYGSLRLRVNAGVIEFDDAGYETTPNQSIMPIIDPPIPEPGTLALLTLGAVGVLGAVTKRRRHE